MLYTFTKEEVNFRLIDKLLIISWLENSVRNEKRLSGEIAFIFCSDKYLLNINKKFLKHNYYTDIITFDYTVKKVISGDIYISINRVLDNAKEFKATFQNELLRVMIHGVLHLCGYTDKTKANARKMRLKEDYYLSLYPNKK